MVKDLGNPNIEHIGTRPKSNQLDLAMVNSDGTGGHFVLYQIDRNESNPAASSGW